MKKGDSQFGEIAFNVGLCATLLTISTGFAIMNLKNEGKMTDFHHNNEIVLIDYEIKEYDTLSSIAEEYNVSYNTLFNYNTGLNEESILLPGMHIQIPQYIEKDKNVIR